MTLETIGGKITHLPKTVNQKNIPNRLIYSKTYNYWDTSVPQTVSLRRFMCKLNEN